MSVFVIAEAACTWRYGNELETAKRSISAAKACGADAWKTQWCSSGKALADRRNMPQNALIYEKRLQYPSEVLERLKSACDDSGIEFMCTIYLAQDIPVIAPYVKRFKVSSFESKWFDFIPAHHEYRKRMVVSANDGLPTYQDHMIDWLWCVSEYPTPLEHLSISKVMSMDFVGLSDHTTSTLTGAVAVGCGAQIIEKHVRLKDTPSTDPDYPHSLQADGHHGYLSDPGKEPSIHWDRPAFWHYVQNIREAERML